GPNAKPIVAGLIGVINPGNTVTVGPGDYTLKLTTFTGPNMAGATSVWAPIRVDNAPPAVAITKPADGAFTGAMVEVDGTVSDIVGSAHYGPADDLKQIDIIVDGVAHHVTPSGNAFTAQFTLADGDHVITAVAADLAGNHAAAPLAGPPATPPNTIHVDTVPPKILIFSPVPQPASISFHNGTFVVAGAVDDAHPATWSIGLTAPAGVQVKASDVLSATSGTGANITATFNTKAAPDGRYTLTFTATDQAKNTATNSVDFYVDNTPPSPKFISPTPADGAIVNTLQTAAATITDNIPDSNNVLLYQILENGVPRLTPPGRKTPPSTITNVALQNPPANGAHVLQIVATDQAGNTNTPDVASGSQRTFFFDNIPPTIVSIQYTAPGSTSGMGVLDGSYLKNQIRIVITARDNLSNPGNILVPMVTLSGNGKSIPLTPNPVAGVTYTGSDLMWTADLPITPAASEDPNDPTPDPSNGLYRIDVSMTDKAGNTATSSATFNVVNGPPSASLRIPSYNLVDEFANALTYHPHPDMPMPGKPNLHPVGRKYYNDTPNGSTFTDVSVAYLRPNAKTLVFPEEMAVNSTLAGHNFVYTNPTPRAGNATGDVIPFSTFLLQLTDKQTQTLTVTQPGGSNVVLGAPILTPEGKFTMVFTATNAATDPASGLITQVDSRQLSVVVDSSSPVVTPLVPVNGVGSPIVVVPSSLFNFSFKINKPLKDVTAIAPILRDSATNAPVAIATVFRVSDGKQILSPISLASVISSPNLNGQGGIATFSGDAFRGFTVNWQMPVLPALYAAKQEYRVDITGVQDVVGNAAPTKVSYFFTVNVN
ncbi:MAG TPA: Ig-like domain-containing protein, partial [Chthonomonadaceae bacterium]|nr:Ig-like domain-containing protein [Chthonomonadaceae bacterium]